LSKIHGNQLAIGDKYQQIKASYGISFLNFVIFEDFPETTHNFIPTHTIYKDCVFKENQMVYIEMPKVQTINKNSPAIEKLVYLLHKANQMEDDMANDIVFEDPALNQIYEDYLKVTENREFMALLEAKEKFWRDAEAEKDFVEARGKAEGLAKGLAEGKAEVVQSMHAEGFDNDTIARITKLTLAEVQQIIAEQA
jgi:predicted transposase/invertase (TIGR01784 family)